MRQLLELKFNQPEFREKLLLTQDEDLIEGNWWHDNIWGDCSCPKCKDIPGKNRLGILLMEIRSQLQNQ